MKRLIEDIDRQATKIGLYTTTKFHTGGQPMSPQTKASYTSGPWTMGHYQENGHDVWQGNSKINLRLEANARLIAAAPALLEALKAMLDEHSECKGCESSDMALKAIAYAEGQR